MSVPRTCSAVCRQGRLSARVSPSTGCVTGTRTARRETTRTTVVSAHCLSPHEDMTLQQYTVTTDSVASAEGRVCSDVTHKPRLPICAQWGGEGLEGSEGGSFPFLLSHFPSLQ